MLLAAGEVGNLSVGVRQHLHLFKALPGNLAVFLPRPLKQAKMPVAPHKYNIHDAHRKIPIYRFTLRHIAHTAEIILYRLAKDLDPAAAHRQQSHGRLDQGGFSCAVGANNPDKLPSRNLNIHPPQHRPLMIGNREVMNLKWHRVFRFCVVCAHLKCESGT